jgi:hypothetical protein
MELTEHVSHTAQIFCRCQFCCRSYVACTVHTVRTVLRAPTVVGYKFWRPLNPGTLITELSRKLVTRSILIGQKSQRLASSISSKVHLDMCIQIHEDVS